MYNPQMLNEIENISSPELNLNNLNNSNFNFDEIIQNNPKTFDRYFYI